MVQRCDNLVDLDKWSKMTIQLQKSVPIQPITSPLKFDGLTAKSEKDTVSYLSTEARRARPGYFRRVCAIGSLVSRGRVAIDMD